MSRVRAPCSVLRAPCSVPNNLIQWRCVSFRYLTDLLLCSLQLGFCCVYVVFISHNIQVVAGILDVRIWMLIILPTLLIPSLITDIGRLAYLTSIGNLIILAGVGIIYHYMLTHLMNPSELPKFNGVMNACVGFGQTIYAFEGIAVVCIIFLCRLFVYKRKLRVRGNHSAYYTPHSITYC